MSLSFTNWSRWLSAWTAAAEDDPRELSGRGKPFPTLSVLPMVSARPAGSSVLGRGARFSGGSLVAACLLHPIHYILEWDNWARGVQANLRGPLSELQCSLNMSLIHVIKES